MRRPCPPCASWQPCRRWWLSASAASTTTATSPPARCRMRYSTPSWHWPPSSGCRCFSTAAMPTPVLSRSSVPGCRNCREPCCTASPVPTRSWTSVWRWGWHIGVTGWLCDERRGQLLREQVARIPAGRLMIETDAPYLVPRDLKPRPKRNEPAFLPHIAQVVAACRGEAPEALLAHTRATSAAFFQLPLQE